METDKEKITEYDEFEGFLIDILTDMETLKNLIYNGSDVAAYRNLQKISDKIRSKIRDRLRNKSNVEENRENS